MNLKQILHNYYYQIVTHEVCDDVIFEMTIVLQELEDKFVLNPTT